MSLTVLKRNTQSSLLVKDLAKMMMQSHASRGSGTFESVCLAQLQSSQISRVERSRHSTPVSNVQHQMAENLVLLVLGQALENHTLRRLVFSGIVEDGDGLPHSHVAEVSHGGHVVEKRSDGASMHGSQIVENVVGDGELESHLRVALVVVGGLHGLASVVEQIIPRSVRQCLSNSGESVVPELESLQSRREVFRSFDGRHGEIVV